MIPIPERSPQVSCLTTCLLVDYLRAHDVDPARLVEGLPCSLAELSNRFGWIDLDTIKAVERRIPEVSPHPEDPYYHFGFWMFHATGRSFFRVFTRGLASPRQAYATLPAIIPRFVMPFLVVDYEPVGPAGLRLRFRCTGEADLTDAGLRIFQGQLAAMPTFFAEPEARVSVTREGPGVAAFEITMARASDHPLGRLGQWLVRHATRLGDRLVYIRDAARQFEEASSVLAARVEELSEARLSLARANEELRREKAELEHLSTALAASERRYRLLAEASQDVIFTLDREGRVRYVNAAGARALGRPAEEVLGRTHHELFPPDVADRQARAVAEVFASGRPLRREDAEPYAAGLRNVETQLVPLLEADGALHEVLGVARDVTERVRAEAERRRHEAELLQAQQLESLGLLAGGIAHDFNNLLSTILASSDLLERQLPDAAAPRPHVGRIRTAALQAADLCRLMLACAGKDGQRKELVDLGDVVTETASLVRASVPRTVALDLRLPAGLPAVHADPVSLRQIVLNLLTNAAEALGEGGGQVTVAVAVRHPPAEELARGLVNAPLPAGRYLELRVEDSGCGIDEANRRRLFEPFFTTKFAGRGLGLPAVLGAVRGLGGTVWFDSAPGRGATFTVLLPASDLPAAVQPAPLPEEPWSTQGTVLLVDDERGVREVGQEILESAGFTVLTAQNGQEALDVYRAHRAEIACVVLDLTMPRMDGADALRRLRDLDPDLRVLLTSGHHAEDVAARFADQDPVQFMPKPYRPASLLQALRRLLDSQAPAAARP